MIAWMRVQSGTSSLRAILYMDEIFGYFPPTANPPSKQPMLTLLKQARAFGLGCVLATQNPVDLDYKGLSNAGTWFIGRLQTERDKLRVLEGLESALAGSGDYDRATLDRMISGLTQRVFLMRNVHDDAPVLFKSRWALSYLRGPLTGVEISRLMADRKTAAGRQAAAQSPRPRHAAARSGRTAQAARPSAARRHPRILCSRDRRRGALIYRPMVMGIVKLHFVDAKLALDQWRTLAYLAPLSDDGSQPLWNEAQSSGDLKQQLQKTPASGATFGELPAAAMRAASYAAWGKAWPRICTRPRAPNVLVCDALKASSAPDESEGDFRAQLARARASSATPRSKRCARSTRRSWRRCEDRARRAQERIEREKSQLSQQKLQTAFSIGASVLGAFFGRKAHVGNQCQSRRDRGALRDPYRPRERRRRSRGRKPRSRAAAARDLQQQFDADSAALERVTGRRRGAAAHGAGQPAQVRHRGRRGRAGVDAVAQGRRWLSGAGICRYPREARSTGRPHALVRCRLRAQCPRSRERRGPGQPRARPALRFQGHAARASS